MGFDAGRVAAVTLDATALMISIHRGPNALVSCKASGRVPRNIICYLRLDPGMEVCMQHGGRILLSMSRQDAEAKTHPHRQVHRFRLLLKQKTNKPNDSKSKHRLPAFPVLVTAAVPHVYYF